MPKIVKNIWTLPRYKKEWRNICALLPIYLSDGTNGSYILYEDGSIEQVSFRLSWVIDDLLAYWCSNKTLLQEQSCQIAAQLGNRHQRRIPLALREDFCLVPVRARLTSSRNHDANGYVFLNRVKEISQQKEQIGCKISFQSQVELEVLDSMRTLKRNLQLAEKMTEYLRKEESLA